MSDEGSFLRAILTNPADDLPRLVYADWLDEQQTDEAGRKAEFLRWQVAVSRGEFQPGGRSRKERRRVLRARHLAETLPVGWLAAVSHAAVENCAVGGTAIYEWRLRRALATVEFAYECPKDWAALTLTDDEKVRHCGQCQRNVHFCETIFEARHHAWAGECVAVAPGVPRSPDDLERPRPMMLGVVAPDSFDWMEDERWEAGS